MSRVICILPTHGRSWALPKAIMSISGQQRSPDRLLIVGECSEDFGGLENDIQTNCLYPRIEWLINERTAGLSGSVNTALLHLLKTGESPEDTFISLLDDDDCWDPGYLETCLDEAETDDLDWVISGLVRQEPDGREIELSIPNELSPTLFFRGNPHIQGSNLFLKLSKLLEAGLFDENLPSTTDRDICIRLLDLGDVRYGSVLKHLVHHNAGNYPRLSTPGSTLKRQGLERFLLKYRPRMSGEDQRIFLGRAKTLFDLDLSKLKIDKSPTQEVDLPENVHDFQLVIGFTATHIDCVKKLVGDIVDVAKELIPVKVVVCDNCDDAKSLEEALSVLGGQGIEVKLKTVGEIDKDSENGLLGNYYMDKRNRQGIAFGRTGLHHYLYLESYQMPNPVVWVLDDDMRLKDPVFRGQRLDGRGIFALISGLMEEKVSVAVGGICGDPPLPIASSVRVQLLEMHSAIRALLADGSSRQLECEEAYRDHLQHEYPDSYYDLTLAHFGHLETPWGGLSDDPIRDFMEKTKGFTHGHDTFRPALPIERPSSAIPTRGGNTIVLDVETLRTFPNLAPVVSGLDLRRGDTLWCLLTAQLGGEMMLAPGKKVISFPFFLKQERSDAVEVSPILGSKLISDMWGAAFTRAFEALMNEVTTDPERRNPWSGLKLSEEEIERFLDQFAKHISDRKILISANAWRVRGLVKSIRAAMELSRSDGQSVFAPEPAFEIKKCLTWIESEYSPDKVRQFLEAFQSYNALEIKHFLAVFCDNRLTYSTRLPVAIGETEIDSILHAMETMGIRDVRPTTKGGEGIILTDGIKAYKYFYAGTAHFERDSLDFLEKVLMLSKAPRQVVPLERVIVQDGNVVFQMPFIMGENYSGGHLDEMIELLRSCKEAGLAMKNIAPDNFRVGINGLMFTDLGRDVKPYSEALFREMCKRAYLCYRWHFRPDLKELMRLALRDENLPELFGFETFLESVEPNDGNHQIETCLIPVLTRYPGNEVLDYGCREGTLSNVIARMGKLVRCYDIDMSRFTRIEHEKNVIPITRAELDKRIEEKHSFEIVFCCRVLCTVDEDEVDSILIDLRRMASEEGRVVIGICNPFNLEASWTTTHLKHNKGSYRKPFTYHKTIESTGRTRSEHHRDVSWYKKRFLRAGFDVERMDESSGIDVERLSPGSELIFFTLRPIEQPCLPDVSLLIKASSMEWRTIDAQVRHIVKQLEGPERFLEKIVVTDRWAGPFSRQYDTSNPVVFFDKLKTLIEEGTIDRILVLDEHESSEINRRWFGFESPACRSLNGQPVHIVLNGIDKCQGKYVLQVDSDCLITRQSRTNSYLKGMVDLLERDERSVTVSMPIRYGETREFTNEGPEGNWRTEVRCSLLSKSRLLSMLPLGNSIKDGLLELPWHRALDKTIAELEMHSYRGGDPSTSFIHVPNDRKKDINEWYNLLQAVEEGRLPKCQYDRVDLIGDLTTWLPPRKENLIFLLRGRNVPIPLLRRCLMSIERQSIKEWGLIIIDAASDNGTEEFVKEIVKARFSGRVTLLQNLEPLTPMENIDIAIRHLCQNPESVIAMVDSDDALIGEEAARTVMEAYDEGADLTVGSMLRTDKHKEYPVEFSDPRSNRGGNVWQHLRTFKKKLYDGVPQEYLKLDGNWIQHTEDWAFMIPMVELSNNPVHIRKSIYFYQPSSEKKSRLLEERERMISEILSKPSLKGVDT